MVTSAQPQRKLTDHAENQTAFRTKTTSNATPTGQRPTTSLALNAPPPGPDHEKPCDYALSPDKPSEAREVRIVRITGQKSIGLTGGLGAVSLGRQRLDFEYVGVPGQLPCWKILSILFDEAESAMEGRCRDGGPDCVERGDFRIERGRRRARWLDGTAL